MLSHAEIASVTGIQLNIVVSEEVCVHTVVGITSMKTVMLMQNAAPIVKPLMQNIHTSTHIQQIIVLTTKPALCFCTRETGRWHA